MKNISLILTVLLLSTSTYLFSQNVGINISGNTADPSSMLDVSATDKGVLIPRISLINVTNSTAPVNSPAMGLLVYNTNALVVGGSGEGFYYWSGSVWTKLSTGTSATTLTDGRIWIGNGSNLPTEQIMGGDATLSSGGVLDINDLAVETSEINNLAVTTAKIADNNITTAKLADGNVTTVKIADANVTSIKIADGTVANVDMANMPALSIKGNATNAAAPPTDISASTDGHVLRRNGTSLGFGTLTNAALANSSVTVNAGTGMSGGGAVALGSSITLNNAGVLSLAGTVNQVNISASTGNITLSTPQNIHTGANTIFNSVTAPNDFFGRINIEDTRDINAAPNTYSREVHFEFKNRGVLGSPGTGTYGGLMTLAPWSDNSGNNHHQLFFNDGGIFYRTGLPAGGWNSWTQLLTATQMTGTTNTVAKFTGTNSIGNSSMTDDGTTLTTTGQFDVTGGTGTAYTTAPIEVRTTNTPRVSFHWPGVVASQIGMDAAGVIRTYNNPGTGYEQFAASNITANGFVNINSASTAAGNLRFTAANPYIVASSYFIAPGGAYFNSGTVYTEASLRARGGVSNDAGATLSITGGTSGTTTISGILGVGTASTLYGANTSIYANPNNTNGGGIMVSDDGGFVDYNDGPVTFVGSTGLRIAGNNGANSSNAYLRINGLSGSGNRVVRADPNGVLTTEPNACPANFTTINFINSRLCIYNDAFANTTWNQGATWCYTIFGGASICRQEQLRRACNQGGYALTPSRWMADRAGDDVALTVNGTDCNNFDGTANAVNGTQGGTYCCIEYWR